MIWTPTPRVEPKLIRSKPLNFVRAFGLDVNAVTDKGETALHGAACKGANSVIQSLLDNGAKVTPNKQGFTPLDIAMEKAVRMARFSLPKRRRSL
jgi:ankyrin repeat protein